MYKGISFARSFHAYIVSIQIYTNRSFSNPCLRENEPTSASAHHNIGDCVVSQLTQSFVYDELNARLEQIPPKPLRSLRLAPLTSLNRLPCSAKIRVYTIRSESTVDTGIKLAHSHVLTTTILSEGITCVHPCKSMPAHSHTSQ